MRQQYLNQAKRLVIKIGSSLVASRQEGLRMTQLQRLASEITALLHQGLGQETILECATYIEYSYPAQGDSYH
jgi:glutamate 5-kinase